jgi:hypothetical protein
MIVSSAYPLVLRRMSNGKADAFAEELEHALHIKEQEQVRIWVHPGGWDGLRGRERGGEKWRGQRERGKERGDGCVSCWH